MVEKASISRLPKQMVLFRSRAKDTLGVAEAFHFVFSTPRSALSNCLLLTTNKLLLTITSPHRMPLPTNLITTLVAAAVVALLYNEQRKKRSKRRAPRRFGGAIRLDPAHYARYRQLHDNVWPPVLQRMYDSNIRNFSIYYHKETNTLFQTFEWIGHWKDPNANEEDLFEKDMEAIANDPTTRRWWKECEPCQIPFSQWKKDSKLLSEGGSGEWWAPLECVAHCGFWPVQYGDKDRDPDFETLFEVD